MCVPSLPLGGGGHEREIELNLSGIITFFSFITIKICIKISSVDPTFHFDADPNPDQNPTTSFTHGGKSEFFKTHCGARLHCFILTAIVMGVIIFNIFGQYMYVFVSFDQMDQDPDPPNCDRYDRIRIHNDN